jgi:hypothetical protein
MRITCPRCQTNAHAPDGPIDRPLRCPVCEKVLLEPRESQFAVRSHVAPTQPLEGSAQTTTILMTALLLAGLATTVIGVRILIVAPSGPMASVAPESEGLLQFVSGLLGLSMLAAFVAFLVWKYRAYGNLLGRCSILRSTPQGAVGWYFCPIMSLWKPYEAMKDIWCGSPHDCAAEVSILRGWWAALVGGMLCLMFGDFFSAGVSPASPGPALVLRTLAGGLLAIWAMATIMVTSAVTRWQRRWIDGDRTDDTAGTGARTNTHQAPTAAWREAAAQGYLDKPRVRN